MKLGQNIYQYCHRVYQKMWNSNIMILDFPMKIQKNELFLENIPPQCCCSVSFGILKDNIGKFFGPKSQFHFLRFGQFLFINSEIFGQHCVGIETGFATKSDTPTHNFGVLVQATVQSYTQLEKANPTSPAGSNFFLLKFVRFSAIFF